MKAVTSSYSVQELPQPSNWSRSNENRILAFDRPRETRKIFSGVKVAQPRTITRRVDDVFRVSKHVSSGPKKMMMSLKRKYSGTTTNIEISDSESNHSRNTVSETELQLDSEKTHKIDTAHCNSRDIHAARPLTKYRLKEKKWTRWDVVDIRHNVSHEPEECDINRTDATEDDITIYEVFDSSTQEMSASEAQDEKISVQLNDSVMDDDDDELQSDDDVVGPWHDVPHSNSNDMNGSKECIDQDNATGMRTEASDSDITILGVSNYNTTSLAYNVENKDEESNNNKVDLVVVEGSKDSSNGSININGTNGAATKRKAPAANREMHVMDRVIARKATTKQKAKPLQPPTKSPFARKTDKKMKQQTATKGKKGKKKAKKAKIVVQPGEDFSTTGAFLTRGTARQLADPHGFQPNTFNYHYMQSVEVLNINGCWYSGTLLEMNSGKVKVKYTDWKEHEWIIIGSRRLRPVPLSSSNDGIGPGEEQGHGFRTVSKNEQKISTATANEPQADLHSDVAVMSESTPLLLGKPITYKATQMEEIAYRRDLVGETDVTDVSNSSDGPENQLPREEMVSVVTPVRKRAPEPSVHEYRTTGAFATRNALRELADPHGFTPNAYGFVFIQMRW
jgi:hypothetical protein